MSKIPENYYYTTTHEWARLEEDNSYTIGVTEHAQYMLGEIVFVDLPPEDLQINAGEASALVESSKAAADIYAPISGVIVEVNETLESTPNLINQDPYDRGWLFRITPLEREEITKLMDAKAYESLLKLEAN